MHTHTLTIKTRQKDAMEDITKSVKKLVNDSGINQGFVHLFVPHTTAAVTINENTDPDVIHDMLFGLRKSLPDRREYRHAEGNSEAHIKASVIGVSETIPIVDGQLSLGVWQGIFLCEFDGPRSRKLIVQMVG